MEFPRLLPYSTYVFCIEGYLSECKDNLIDGHGYIIKTPDGDELIAIYKKDKVKKPSYIALYVNNDQIDIIKPDGVDVADFQLSKSIDLSVTKMKIESRNIESLYTPEEINNINLSSNDYVPKLEEDDDFLKKIIKTAIINKGINVKALKSLFPASSKHSLPNLISSLNNTTKMSVNKFAMWCELLGLDFTLTVTDNGRDRMTPLMSDLTYTSTTNSITEVDED